MSAQKTAERDEALLEAVLAFDSLKEAAAAAGVPYSTARRRLGDPTFQEQLRLARQRVYDAAMTRLQGLADQAVSVVDNALKAGNVRVAQWVLERGADGYLSDLEKRVAALEKGRAAP